MFPIFFAKFYFYVDFTQIWRSFCLVITARNLRIQWLRDLCRVSPSYYCKQHSYPFINFSMSEIVTFASFLLLFWVRCSKISVVWYLKVRELFSPQFICSSITYLHIFFNQCNFILKESLKLQILLKSQIFHKIKSLFTRRVTKFSIYFNLKIKPQVIFFYFVFNASIQASHL